MPRPRNPENRKLPTRWRLVRGTYYYQVPPGHEGEWDGKQTFRLGKTLAEAHAAFAQRIKDTPEVRTIGQLLDRYALEVVPGKAPKTQVENLRSINKEKGLRERFGHMALRDFRPMYVYTYVDKATAKVSAHRDIEVLSHAFTKAVQWGLIDRHPFKGEVRLEGEAPRDRHLEDWEITAMFSLQSKRKAGSVKMVQAFLRLKLLTGMRRGDLLRLTMSDIREDGIHAQPNKTRKTTGKRLIYAWEIDGVDTGRRAAVEECKAARPCLSQYLFCKRDGTGYLDEETGRSDGFDSVWQRFVDRVLAETEVSVRFTDSDLRAKVGTEQETIERAQRLLGHADPRMTVRAYRRKPEVV